MPKRKNPSDNDGWIPVHAIRKLPDGSIQLMTEKGVMSNPGKRKKFIGKVKKLFSKAKRAISNPYITTIFELKEKHYPGQIIQRAGKNWEVVSSVKKLNRHGLYKTVVKRWVD